MKRFLIILLVLCASSFAFGETPDLVKLTISSVSTNASPIAADIATSQPITGFFDGFYLDLTGYASATVDVDIVTVATNGMSKSARTLWTKDSVAADVEKYVRTPTVNPSDTAITSVADLIPLLNDKIQIKVYDAVATNATGCEIWLYIRRP